MTGDQTQVSRINVRRRLHYTMLAFGRKPAFKLYEAAAWALAVCVGRFTTYDLRWSYEFGGLVGLGIRLLWLTRFCPRFIIIAYERLMS